jgi:hypothetical protein
MPKILLVFVIVVCAAPPAAALTLPPFEIIPAARVVDATISYTAFKIDRVNNQISYCIVSQSQPSGTFTGRCFRKVGANVRTSVAGTVPYVPSVLAQELWLIDLDSGAVQFCIFAPEQACIPLPDL